LTQHAESQRWWFCLDHRSVESDNGCKNAERLGPYQSREEASRALQIAAERTEAWDNDPDWNDDKR
jgi:hypothetical protein